ncbi:phosphotransferase [Aquibacillus sediminis]|uniref:phosphotransferase n=1 Tax=Aquibacillus sediminis TaxID=2574734 RepID=UPI001108193E|nr:phosphotransferase [Aquibacillus sediminis]
MKDIQRILEAYQINATEIVPITNRVYKIHSHNYTYALKRSRLTKSDIDKWSYVYQLANQQQISSILPVYMTRNGQVFYHDNQSVYYVTPWIEKKEIDEPEHEIDSFYQELAKLHQQTRQANDLRSDQLDQVIYQEKEKMNHARNRLLTFVETFEQRHYMSPFELHVCMQYRDIDYVFQQLADWYDFYLEDIESYGHGAYVLCHGNLRASHKIFQHNKTYFINWERAFYGSPVNDLARYFYNELKYHDSYLDQFIQSFSIYERYNPLKQSERSLLAIYLLTPSNYLRVVENYHSANNTKAQAFQIRELEYQYRRLMNGLNVQQHFHQIREELKEQELDQELEDD